MRRLDSLCMASTPVSSCIRWRSTCNRLISPGSLATSCAFQIRSNRVSLTSILLGILGGMAALEVPNVLEANQLVQLIHRVRRHIPVHGVALRLQVRSEEHTSELQSLMRILSSVFCLTKKQ